MSEVIAFRLLPENGPDGAKLDAILSAHWAHQRTKATRYVFVHLVAVLGVLVAVGALWPGLAPAQLQHVAVALWAVCGAGALAAGVGEWKCRRRETQLLARNAILEESRGTRVD